VWGLTTSQTAKDQIAAFNFSVIAKPVYVYTQATSHGAVTEDASAEEQLTTLNSV